MSANKCLKIEWHRWAGADTFEGVVAALTDKYGLPAIVLRV